MPLIYAALPLVAALALPSWDFAIPEQAAAWMPNTHITDTAQGPEGLTLRTIDWDPFLICDGLEIPATPWQAVALRIRASRPGRGELFWTGTAEGPDGGFAQSKSTPFQLQGTGEWEEAVILPFWHGEGDIRRLRLDLYDDAEFTLGALRVYAWGMDSLAPGEQRRWEAPASGPWQKVAGTSTMFSPPLRLDVSGHGWVSVRLQSGAAGAAAVLWAAEGAAGLHREVFDMVGAAEARTYNIELQGHAAWKSPVVALGLELPPGLSPEAIEAVELRDVPGGPPAVEVAYFGFEDAPNRAGRPAALLARLRNDGGARAAGLVARLDCGDGLRLLDQWTDQTVSALGYGDMADLRWHVEADAPGTFRASLTVAGDSASAAAQADLTFTPAPGLPPAEYVPAPQPVPTNVQVWAYYFPGWNSPTSWTPIRRTAPQRKPVLGYYDEALAEVVDWQIKWAVENGIAGFLVDWYWVRGSQHLTHWLEAYAQARYRNELGVALMWANHNPPGSHSLEDWREVTAYWIEHFFDWTEYWRIDGKPAVFLWDPALIRSDLGGSGAVREAFEMSHAMAREAGYPGIAFFAMRGAESPGTARMLQTEGYTGVTNYHEWGEAPGRAASMRQMRFTDVVETAPAAWRRKRANAQALAYLPVADTGWDARPWHGNRSDIIHGRTVALFGELLGAARAFLEETGQDVLVLGPVNEWGEGSYIEPNTEFGFGMLEAVREVFAEGPPESWPVNIAPVDVGLGPYDFPEQAPVWSWDFSRGREGWQAAMNIAEFRHEDGALRFRTVSHDPALKVDVHEIHAERHPRLYITMRYDAAAPLGAAQLFWSIDGQAIGEAASMRFELGPPGRFQTYRLELVEHPRWRGAITQLRFDPCEQADVEVALAEVVFERTEDNDS